MISKNVQKADPASTWCQHGGETLYSKLAEKAHRGSLSGGDKWRFHPPCPNLPLVQIQTGDLAATAADHPLAQEEALCCLYWVYYGFYLFVYSQTCCFNPAPPSR